MEENGGGDNRDDNGDGEKCNQGRQCGGVAGIFCVGKIGLL